MIQKKIFVTKICTSTEFLNVCFADDSVKEKKKQAIHLEIIFIYHRFDKELTAIQLKILKRKKGGTERMTNIWTIRFMWLTELKAKL